MRRPACRPTMPPLRKSVSKSVAFSAESSGGGVRVNVIPKEGGNTFSGLLFANFANESMSSDNFTGVEKFALSGVRAPDRIKTHLRRELCARRSDQTRTKLWFFTAHRHWGFQNYKADAFYEVNPIDYIWDYAPGSADAVSRCAGVRRSGTAKPQPSSHDAAQREEQD